MKKILLTGSNGFIGSHLYSQIEGQISVTSVDYGDNQNAKEIINLDLTNTDNVNYFAENCDHFDVLIFLVGLAHAKGKGKELPEFKIINYQTLVNLLSELDKRNKLPDKIIFSSTISVYGEKINQNVYNEDSDTKPFSPYAVTKLQAEQYLKENFGNRSWILRFAPVYSSTFFLNINRRTKIGSLFYCAGNGSNKLSICNIKNIKSAIDGIINNIIPAGVYNISDNKSYNYNELLKWQGASFVLRVPKLIVQFLFYFGKLFGNIFLRENTTKLLTNNIYPNNKITAFIDLPFNLYDIKLDNKVNS